MTKLRPVRDFRVEDLTRADTSIVVGDTVRSYDFEHLSDCYVEGEVVGTEIMEGCDRYKIRATRRVISGEELLTFNEFYLPPVNGTRCLFGGWTNGVRKL